MTCASPPEPAKPRPAPGLAQGVTVPSDQAAAVGRLADGQAGPAAALAGREMQALSVIPGRRSSDEWGVF